MTLEELKVVITAQTSGLKREIDNVNRQLNGLSNNTQKATNSMNKSFGGLTKTLSSLAKAVASVGVIKIGIEGVKDLEGAQASLNALNRVLGEEATDALQTWSDNTAKYLGLGRGEALRTAQFMGSILTGFIDPNDVAQATTQLIGQMSIMANATKKPMAQIEEAIQSAFLGSFERVENIIPTMTRGLADQYAQVYYNAEAFSKLNGQQQRFIMYQMIMAESAQMYGNSLSGPMVQMMMLKASLQDLKLQFGAAFATILQVVMPVIQAIANGLSWLVAVIAGVAQAIASVFGKSSKGAKAFTNDIKSVAPAAAAATPAIGGVSSGLNDAAKGAKSTAKGLSDAEKNAKKLKGSLMGFDEINTLNMDDGSTGSLGSLPDMGGIEMPDMGGVITDLGALGNMFGGVEEKFNAFSQKLSDMRDRVAKVAEWIINAVKKATPYVVGFAAVAAGALTLSGIAAWIFDWDTVADVAGDAALDVMAQGSKFDGFFGKIVKGPKNMATAMKAGAGVVVQELALVGTSVGGLMLKIPGLSGIGTALLGGSAGTLAAAGAAVIAVITAIVGAFVYLWNTSETFRQSWINVWENIKELLSSVWENILKPIFEAIGIALMIIWEEGLKPLWEAWTMIWEQISGILTDFLNFLMPIITAIIDWLGPKITPILQFLGAAFGTMVSVATGWLSGMFKSVADIIGNIRGVFNGIIDFVKNVFTGNWRGAWDAVKSIFSNIFDGFGNIAKAPINAVIGGVNAMIRGLNKVKLPDWVPVFGGKGINIPEIPRLAKGGIVSSGQQYIAGEAGREAIVPLDHNNQWASTIADTVLMKMGGMNQPQGSDKPLEVVLQVGTTKLGKVAIDSINKLQRQEGRVLLNL